jgi:DNA-binding NarL/FixJ family response regulator
MERVRTITVGIAASEILIRTALFGILEDADDIIVAGEARDGASAVELAKCSRPQVLVMDAASPGMDGLATARLIRRQVPSTQVLLLAGSASGELLFPALQAGASGFMLRNSDPVDLVNAVRAVAVGDAILPPPAIRRLVDRCIGDGAERREKARRRISVLTAREQDVLVHLAKGMSNAAIARTMCLSEGAVKAHVSRLLSKLRCDNRVQAALIARDAGMPGG